MQLGTITRNHIVGLIIFLELVLGGCFVWFYALPNNASIQELDKTIAEKQRKNREIEQTKRNLAEQQQEITKLKQELVHLEKFFSEEVYIPTTLKMLEELAQATQVDIISFKPAAAAAKGPARSAGAAGAATATTTAAATGTVRTAGAAGASKKPKKVFNKDDIYKTTVIDIALKAEFKSLYNFLLELSSFPKLVVVDKIEMSRDQVTAGTGVSAEQAAAASNKLQIKMPMTFYIQKKQSLVPISPEEAAAANEKTGSYGK